MVTITEMTGMGEATEWEGETEIRIGVVEGAVSQEEGEVAEGDMVILQPIIINDKILLFYF